MSQPQQIIFSASPIHWPDGVECSFGQLAAVIAKAKADGFVPTRMTVRPGGYSLRFQRADRTTPTNANPNEYNAGQ